MAHKAFRTPMGVFFAIPEEQFEADTQAYATAVQAGDHAAVVRFESGDTGWQRLAGTHALHAMNHGVDLASAVPAAAGVEPVVPQSPAYAQNPAMRLVIVESPFAGDVARNIEYARLCVRDSLLRGEAPIASHLLYTQPGILNDDIPAERQHGIDAGLAWRAVAQASVVYTDLGISKGMEYGIKAAQAAGIPVEYRSLSGFVKESTDVAA